MSDDVVYRFRKNSREEVRAALTTFRGVELADLRIYAGDGDAARPTPKGIAVRIDDLPLLLDAVAALVAAREARAA